MCKVSVIIPTLGREEVTKAIKSVKDQTIDVFETIVIDDSGSPSPRLEELDNIVHIQGEPEGLPKARNRGIKISSGDYVAFLDDDDRWVPNKLEQQLKRIDETGAAICTCFRQTPDGSIGRCNLEGNIRKRLMTRNCIGPPSGIIVKREVVERHLFDQECLIWEDREWYIRILDEFDICLVPKVLIIYNDDTGTLSASWDLIKSHGIPCLSKYESELEVQQDQIEAWACRRVGFDHLETSRLTAIIWGMRGCMKSTEWATYRFLFRAIVGQGMYEKIEKLTLDGNRHEK